MLLHCLESLIVKRVEYLAQGRLFNVIGVEISINLLNSHSEYLFEVLILPLLFQLFFYLFKDFPAFKSFERINLLKGIPYEVTK